MARLSLIVGACAVITLVIVTHASAEIYTPDPNANSPSVPVFVSACIVKSDPIAPRDVVYAVVFLGPRGALIEIVDAESTAPIKMWGEIGFDVDARRPGRSLGISREVLELKYPIDFYYFLMTRPFAYFDKLDTRTVAKLGSATECSTLHPYPVE